MNRKIKNVLAICGITLVLLLSVPIYLFCFDEWDAWKRVVEINEQTYVELQETDAMYGDLPYDAEVIEIHKKQQLGDANVEVWIEVSEKSIDEFIAWLDAEGKIYAVENNVVRISYHLSDSHTQFGELELVSEQYGAKAIYWIVVLCMILFPIVYSLRRKHKNLHP